MDNNWLSERAFRAFMELHQKGLAHAVEVWRDRHFVGGIFGVAIGKIFFGEYAFSLEESADEIALLYLIKKLKEKDFQLIDMQKQTMQVSGFELDEMSRTEYVALCKANAEKYATKFRQL
jgi:leucyl/phenylalanyl-tRNA--protein transferase